MSEEIVPKPQSSEEELKALRFVYEEVSSARERRFRTIEMLNQKLNWVLVSAVALFGFALQLAPSYNDSPLYQLGLLSISTSILACFMGLYTRQYKLGPKLEKLIEASKKEDRMPLAQVLRSTNRKIVNDLNDVATLPLSGIIRVATLGVLLATVLITLVVISANYEKSDARRVHAPYAQSIQQR